MAPSPTFRTNWCLVDGDPVLFDIASDRYARLSGEAAGLVASCLESAAGRDAAARDRMLSNATLRSAGIVGPTGLHPPCSHPLPSHALIGDSHPRPSFLLILAASIRLVRMRYRLRRHGLAWVLDHIAEAPAAGHPSPNLPVATLAQAHRWTRRFFLARDACLVRALALGGHARLHGHPVSVVFGVRLRPFAAHCWVEQTGMLLDDELDHVRGFHPIFVL